MLPCLICNLLNLMYLQIIITGIDKYKKGTIILSPDVKYIYDI